MNKIIIIIMVAIVGIGLLIFYGDGNGSSPDGEEVKKSDSGKAPTFSLPDYDGNIVESDDFKGKILVLNAWATWCPFCVNELPEFRRLQNEFPEDIVVIGINRAESKRTAKDYTDKAELTGGLIFLLDSNDLFYKSIGGFSMPETIFVDPRGKLLIHKRGPLAFDEMKEIINTILAEE
jgi:thiol-disulfide isomerase/thioredoxin